MDTAIEKRYLPSLQEEFYTISPEEVEKLYAETVDRWTWETGTDDDWKLLKKLDVERHYRKNPTNKSHKLASNWSVETDALFAVDDELLDQLAKEIAAEIDKEILRALVPSSLL